MDIKHTEITVEKITRNVFVAKCMVTAPIEMEVTMKGHTDKIARQKMELFLDNKPYSHLDKK